jgi:hypothetical protein
VQDADGRERAELQPTGIRPLSMRKMERARHYMPVDFFEAPHQVVTSMSRGGA